MIAPDINRRKKMVRLAVLLSVGVWLVLLIAGDGEIARPARADMVRVSASPYAVDRRIRETPTGADAGQIILAPISVPQANTAAPQRAEQRAIIDVPNTKNMLYVIAARVNLRAEPTTKSAVLAKLEIGAKAVSLQTNDNGWIRVRHLDSGIEGFMAKTFLRTIPPG
jgi:hypothetical protein